MPQDLKYLGLYTFSALMQADAAVLGLLAVFIIYRLQSLETNRRNALDIASNHGSSILSDAERLFLGVDIAEVHAVLLSHRHSIYWKHLVTIAFTDNWKIDSLRLAIPNAITILFHLIVCAIGLYNANLQESVFWLNPESRIILGLFLFIVLILIIFITSYRSLQQFALPNIPSVPVLDLKSIPTKQVIENFPIADTRKHFFRINHKTDSRYIMLSKPQNGFYQIQTIIHNSEDQFLTVHTSENLTEKDLESHLTKLKENTNPFWTLSVK